MDILVKSSRNKTKPSFKNERIKGVNKGYKDNEDLGKANRFQKIKKKRAEVGEIYSPIVISIRDLNRSKELN